MSGWTPTAAAARAAREALDVRASLPRSQRAGTLAGLARARQLAARRHVSDDTVRRMVSFFARNARFAAAAPPSKSWQAWNLWGGDAAREALEHRMACCNPRPADHHAAAAHAALARLRVNPPTRESAEMALRRAYDEAVGQARVARFKLDKAATAAAVEDAARYAAALKHYGLEVPVPYQLVQDFAPAPSARQPDLFGLSAGPASMPAARAPRAQQLSMFTNPASVWDRLPAAYRPFTDATPADPTQRPWRVSHADRALAWLRSMPDTPRDVWTDYERPENGVERVRVGLRHGPQEQLVAPYRVRLYQLADKLERAGWPVHMRDDRLDIETPPALFLVDDVRMRRNPPQYPTEADLDAADADLYYYQQQREMEAESTGPSWWESYAVPYGFTTNERVGDRQRVHGFRVRDAFDYSWAAKAHDYEADIARDDAVYSAHLDAAAKNRRAESAIIEVMKRGKDAPAGPLRIAVAEADAASKAAYAAKDAWRAATWRSNPRRLTDADLEAADAGLSPVRAAMRRNPTPTPEAVALGREFGLAAQKLDKAKPSKTQQTPRAAAAFFREVMGALSGGVVGPDDVLILTYPLGVSDVVTTPSTYGDPEMLAALAQLRAGASHVDLSTGKRAQLARVGPEAVLAAWKRSNPSASPAHTLARYVHGDLAHINGSKIAQIHPEHEKPMRAAIARGWLRKVAGGYMVTRAGRRAVS